MESHVRSDLHGLENSIHLRQNLTHAEAIETGNGGQLGVKAPKLSVP